MELLLRLAVALAIGLLVGIERGWHGRAYEEGQRVAGIRTFGLIALLGALWGLLAEEMGESLLGFAFLGFSALVVSAHLIGTRVSRDYGITTAVAALLTFCLGALSARGLLDEAVSTAVVATLLLGLKPELHGLLQRIEKAELLGALKLLLISLVLLPVLPNRPFGPWGAVNPAQLWLLVVLIAAIGFAGYIALRLAGPRLGLLLTGLLGGLVSSTAITLNFARLGRAGELHPSILAAGVVGAAATMFPRVIFEVSVVNPALLPHLWLPLVVMTLVTYAAVPFLWREGRSDDNERPALKLPNPVELRPALQFTLLLAAIMLLSKGAEVWFGHEGIYILAAVSGLADVDAITLSLARLAGSGLDPYTASGGILLAAVVNTSVKGMLVAVICGGAMAKRVGLVFGAVILAGGIVLAI